MPGRVHVTANDQCEVLRIHHSAGHDSRAFWWLLYSAGDPTKQVICCRERGHHTKGRQTVKTGGRHYPQPGTFTSGG